MGWYPTEQWGWRCEQRGNGSIYREAGYAYSKARFHMRWTVHILLLV